MNFKRTKQISLISSVVWIVAYCCLFWKSIDARPLNSIQLATGEWDVSIKGWGDPSKIFPSKLEDIQPLVKRKIFGNCMDCVLSLASDGTFVLTPKYVVDNSNQKIQDYKTKHHDLEASVKATKENSLLDLRGSWNVLCNPYCVTDRFYDTLSLKSYPRQQHAEEAFQFVLNCRMWGRHKRQCSYKMTHGTMVSKDQSTPWWKHFGRPIVASFSAVRCSSKPKHTGWIDQRKFGYSMD